MQAECLVKTDAADFMINSEGATAQSIALRRRAAFSSAERHSKRVRWLKRVILFAALAAIAGIFAIGLVDPYGRLPGHISIGKTVLNGSRITMEEPKLSGFKRDGRPYELHAASGVQDIRRPAIVQLNEIDARMTMPDESVVHLVSSQGVYDSKKDFMSLSHAVRVTSTAGYDARLKSADLDFKAGTIVSRQPVTVTTRAATIAADDLVISDSGSDVVFNGDVRSTLAPKANPGKLKKGGL